jgi:dethiobiotin synthetase
MYLKPIFITGIHTGIGKTITSAVLVEKLQADYWKPIQSGDLETSDTITVQSLISNEKSAFHPETYRLSKPFSPHKSAELDNIKIELSNFILPETANQLIIEGAGGLMVPLNDTDLMIDLIDKLKADVILVVQHYLGSINHTLLSLAMLKSRDISLIGIIISGKRDEFSEQAIQNFSGVSVLGFIDYLEPVDKISIKAAGETIDWVSRKENTSTHRPNGINHKR